jgi:hypothetical protein
MTPEAAACGTTRATQRAALFRWLLLCASLAALAIGFATETRCRQTETPGGDG